MILLKSPPSPVCTNAISMHFNIVFHEEDIYPKTGRLNRRNFISNRDRDLFFFFFFAFSNCQESKNSKFERLGPAWPTYKVYGPNIGHTGPVKMSPRMGHKLHVHLAPVNSQGKWSMLGPIRAHIGNIGPLKFMNPRMGHKLHVCLALGL